MQSHSHGHGFCRASSFGLSLLLLAAVASAEITESTSEHATNLTSRAALFNASSLHEALFSSVVLPLQRLSGHLSLARWYQPTLWDMVTLMGTCGLVPGLLFLRKKHKQQKGSSSASIASTSDGSVNSGTDAAATDPGLLKKHSTVRSYTVPGTGYTYPAIRTFYRPHPQGDKLPSDPAPVPLLVFVHGLGGSVAQFHPILISLVNLAPCLSIDLPGCGLSEFSPKAWEAYTVDALAQLLAVVIEEHRDGAHGQGVVLIGHSMGCSLAALLASSTSRYSHLISRHVLGLVGICPKAAPPHAMEVAKFRRLLAIPGPIFDIWRRWDRRGGLDSASIKRFTGPNAEEETKKLQLRFNAQSRTPVWRRMAAGTLPDYSSGSPSGGLPGKETWAGLDVPIFLAAGESDPITPPSELFKIAEYLGKAVARKPKTAETIPDSAAPVDMSLSGEAAAGLEDDKKDLDAAKSIIESESSLSSSEENTDKRPISDVPGPYPRRRLLKSTILPAPASHALLYAPSTSRILAGLIGTFLADHIDKRLSLGWQLQYLSTEGKWDVKNLAKWQAVQPVSEPIAGTFRAMKTLREVDDRHSPKIFVQEWKGRIRAVVDISHESPVYDPKGLEAGGIAYRKFPTVSKLPPSVDEVKSFIALIDSLQASQEGVDTEKAGDRPLIGVHCHYGFNRTGFFIVSYLVERLGYRLQDAIEEFRTKRPPGIRHDHFIDTLYVRYCVGLKKAPTL